MGRMDGKVAVVSGAARGQGRAHAVTLAREGADVVAFDICAGFKHSLTPPATIEDLHETQRLVEAHDRRCIAAKVDARDLPSLLALADESFDTFGRIDALIVNHGIWVVAPNSWELEEDSWQESIDVLLTGAWKVVKAFVPKIIAHDRGGSVVFTSSSNGTTPQPGAIAYCAAKAGLIHMMRVLAWELGSHGVRVNTVNPGSVDTLLISGGTTAEVASANWPSYISHNRNLLPVEKQPPQSIADAVLWLVSDEARYVTGASVPVDSGWTTY
jgi:(+)-trans-carveol dehydrogenase